MLRVANVSMLMLAVVRCAYMHKPYMCEPGLSWPLRQEAVSTTGLCRIQDGGDEDSADDGVMVEVTITVEVIEEMMTVEVVAVAEVIQVVVFLIVACVASVWTWRQLLNVCVA